MSRRISAFYRKKYLIQSAAASTSQWRRRQSIDHAKKEIDYIRNNFLHDTYLSSYGDGDWDDTLQPANAQLKQYMTSSWTVALTYQSITQLATALENEDATRSENFA